MFPKALSDSTLNLALPKGRMQEGVLALLRDAGIHVTNTSRSYRPSVSLEDCDTKTLKPQNIIEMLHLGSRDVGFAGADWVDELGLSDGSVVELLDTRLDPVRIVAAAPKELLDADGALPDRRLVIASEYVRLTNAWIERTGRDALCVRSYGATEVFPPEDADLIVDNTATGTTLRNNGLVILDDLMRSSTRLFAHAGALTQPGKRARIETMVLLLQSVLDARERLMIEVNVGRNQLDAVVEALPCMRKPTIATLFGEEGYAVKAAVPRAALPTLIPLLKERGGSDIVVTKIAQIVV
ncbi:MAG: ATP phosphoribosyltransferase [Myxococcota bacterium]